MPQTMLAMLALSLAALLAFTQQRSTIQSFEERIRNEYTVAVAGLLTEIMELNAARSFDEASTPDWIFEQKRLPTVDDFTVSEHFGRGHDDNFACDLLVPVNTPLCNDVDDIDGITDQLVHVELDEGRQLRFKVSARVEYVDERNTSLVVAHPTHNKLVVLEAWSPDIPHRGRLARLERVVSYDPIKAGAEFELVHGPLTEKAP